MSAIGYRPYAAGDEDQIRELYHSVFGTPFPLDEWHWHYGRDAIIELAQHGDTVVGHYAVQPRPFQVAGRACTAGLVIGTMVAPAFRNITTFVELARRAYARCRERAIPFVYAFPNDNVWLVRKRMLSWQALPSIATLVATTKNLRSIANHAVARLDSDEPLPDAEWLALPAGSSICAALPPRFATWRLRERPRVEYPIYVHREAAQLRGLIALKRYGAGAEAVGHVIAIRVAPGAEGSSATCLLDRALAHFAAEGVERVTTWILPGSPLHDVAQRLGFAPEPGPGKNFGYLAFDDELSATLADATRWDVGMSDSDVF